MLEIRRSHGRLNFKMGILIPGKDDLYIETGPCYYLLKYVIPFLQETKSEHEVDAPAPPTRKTTPGIIPPATQNISTDQKSSSKVCSLYHNNGVLFSQSMAQYISSMHTYQLIIS